MRLKRGFMVHIPCWDHMVIVYGIWPKFVVHLVLEGVEVSNWLKASAELSNCIRYTAVDSQQFR